MIDFCNSVIQIIKTFGWCKQGLLDDKGRSCLLGAMGRAAGIVTEKTKPGVEVYNNIGKWLLKQPTLDKALRAECSASKIMGFHLLDNVIFFNDHRCKNDGDVIAFIEKVKARL